MKIKTSLLVLCAVLCNTFAYGQKLNDMPRRGFPQDDLQLISSRASGEYIMTEFPTIGEVKSVVILAAFADVPFSVSEDSIKALLSKRYNADNYTEELSFEEYSNAYERYQKLKVSIPGSARDYFREQSFGKFVPTFDIIGPVTLDHPRAYYGKNNGKKDVNTGGMIEDACTKAFDKGLTDFTDYDNDGDGIVDIVYVVYAGCDEAQVSRATNKIPDAIWAKASTISLTLPNKMKINRYACSGELVLDLEEVAGIGTFIHEFSHILGLPDFYNTKEEDFTMDVWSVMDYGMYNAEGFVPCGYTAFERYSLGWIPMHTLDTPSAIEIGTTSEEQNGYRIFTSESEADTTSFYVIENIVREGWNRYAPVNGLLISEVTYNATDWRNNTVNTGTYHRHCIVPANNDYNYETANEHLFGNANDEFTLTSTPASITQFGAAMDKPLNHIHYDDETQTTIFNFWEGPIINGCNEQISSDNKESATYDLQGRPVKQPSRGLYIQNGKKYLVL